ncbi:hypothetical protein C3L33_22506, partial [Rhododendron williamsianum]
MIYGGVFMNNVLGLSVLLSLVYFRGLSWEFSAEVLIVLIVCAIMGVAASFSSTFPIWTSLVFQPRIQTRRIAFAKHKHYISEIRRHLKQHALGRLVRDDGTRNEDVIAKFVSLDTLNADFDRILNADFDRILSCFLTLESDFDRLFHAIDDSDEVMLMHLQRTKREHYLLGDQSDEVVEGVENPKKITIQAVLLLLLGTLIATAFADPLVDAVDNFSDATKVLVIVIVCVVMGAFASFRTTFPLWTLFVAFLLYPFSVALVYVLDYVLGWS